MQAATLFLPAGLDLLPARMDSREARAMLLACALQESGFRHRRQVGGPARGWWQFEPIGVRGVLEHPASRTTAERVCELLRYPPDPGALYEAIEHNDALACAFARLLLWRLPQRLPTRGESDYAWSQYIDCWRPGRPHRERWDDNYRAAWESV